jgi:ATP-dependent protease HslVU (ClpYQ) peptidase subunit
MTVTQLIIQISVTFVAAYFGAFLARRTEKFKHLQELRSAAYADFVRGVAQAAERAQSDGMPTTPEQPRGMALVADSRARIAIYGGKDVVHSLSEFIALGAQTCNSDGMQAFANLCRSMRAETGRERVSIENIKRILFS